MDDVGQVAPNPGQGGPGARPPHRGRMVLVGCLAPSQVSEGMNRRTGVPLFDHFHAPLRKRRHWESFHGSWTTFIARQLNKRPLPAGSLAEPHVSLGVAV